KRDQPSLGQDHIGAAKTFLRPANFSSRQLDAAQPGSPFLPTVTAIKKAVLVNAGVVVIGHDLVAFPDFLHILVMNLKQHRPGSVARGNKNLILDDQRGGGGNRAALS